MRNLITTLALPLTLALSGTAFAGSLTLASNDISNGKYMSKTQEFQGFGCEGGNSSHQLSWSGAPEGTEAFALLVHDPDAPTGSGWWHWQAVNIPSPTWPSGPGMAGWFWGACMMRARFWTWKAIPMFWTGPSASTRARRCSGAGWSTEPGATLRNSCMNATMRRISSCGRRTS